MRQMLLVCTSLLFLCVVAACEVEREPALTDPDEGTTQQDTHGG